MPQASVPISNMWSQRLLLVVAATCAAYPRSVPGLFSVEETERIVALFDDSEPSRDVRDDFQVRRTNRWLGGAALAAGAFDWVMAKILAADDSWGGARWADVSSFLAERVEFVLLHAVWKSNLQPDFNVQVCDRFDARFSAVLRELDESNRFVQKSAESTSI